MSDLGLLMGLTALELIPGDPDGVVNDAHGLRTYVNSCRDMYHDLSKLTPGWDGVGGAAFATAQQSNATGWCNAWDQLDQGRSALLTYASALRTAQKSAQSAVDTFDRGLAQAADDGVAPSGYLARVLLDLKSEGSDLRAQADSDLAAARAMLDTAARAAAQQLNALAELPWVTTGLGGLPDPDTSQDPTPLDDQTYLDLYGPVPLDDSQFGMDTVYQRGIGDCWFLSSAGVIGSADPDWIRQHLVENPDGSYDVTLYQDGKPVVVHVSGDIPTGAVTGPEGRPSWMTIYEKAAAQEMGGHYSDIESDDPAKGLAMITGRDTHSESSPSLDSVKQGLADGKVYVAGSNHPRTWNPFDHDVKDHDVVPNHAYMVDQVAMHNGQEMIHLKNPWGPDGGVDADDHKPYPGDVWLTQDQFNDNFHHVSSVSMR